MGCAQSRIENEEAVSRCKDRKILMKEALTARNAFAAAHSGYVKALKSTGAALTDYGHGEAEPAQLVQTQKQRGLNQSVEQKSSQLSHMENLPPPPPPLPNFSPSPLVRSATMPEYSGSKTGEKLGEIGVNEEDGGLRKRKSKGNVVKGERENVVAPPSPSPPITPMAPPPPPLPESKGGWDWDYFHMEGNMSGGLSEFEEIGDDGEGNEEVEDHRFGERDGGKNGVGEREIDLVEPKTPEKTMERIDEEMETPVNTSNLNKFEHSNVAASEAVKRRSNAVSSVNLLKLLEEIDDHFLKASESAQEVSKMLEATRMHYHSNYADNRGQIDHSARVMRVITWNRALKGAPNGDGTGDDLDSEEYETHATILDKLVAWEKKLYDEVKASELMKIEYQKKVALLNKQKKGGAKAESLEKTKAAVSHLHTRYIVDVQSMDSTVSEVNQIRDSQLYPKLVALVGGMGNMWQTMCTHHDSQLKIVTDLKSLDIAHDITETSYHHHERTIQLWNVVQDWSVQFEKLITHQKQYIQSLHSWLKLNLIPIENSLKEKITSPVRTQTPPIQSLIYSWNEYLEKLPDEGARSSISSFAAVIKTIIIHQEEEMKLKEKCEETNKELLKKNHAFEDWYQKYISKRTPQSEDTNSDEKSNDPVFSEKKFVVESLKKRLEDEMEAHQRHCVQVREKSLGSLKMRLPELFRAMSDYAHACCDAYERLRSVSESQKHHNGGGHS